MENKYQIGTTVFGNWTIEHEIGKGSFGQVFAIGRDDFGEHYSAALKVITIPRDKSEVRSLADEGMSVAHTEEYFYSIVEDTVKEFALMSKLKGTTNIVSYEDHQVVQHIGEIGWDILIRMELLSPLSAYLKENPMTCRMAVQIGIDICRGLELCEKNKIVHRDIKPDNIFVSKDGNFKLGDFGVARVMERAVPGSIKGTYNFMAPEVYRGGEYDNRVDLYSLGLMLYKFLNNNRFPFLPLDGSIRYQDTENAFVRRMGGEQIPLPANAPQVIGELILKACAFRPADRFATAAEMRIALENVLGFAPVIPVETTRTATESTGVSPSGGTLVLPIGGDTVVLTSQPSTPTPSVPQHPSHGESVYMPPVPPGKPKKKRNLLVVLLLAVGLPALLISSFLIWSVISALSVRMHAPYTYTFADTDSNAHSDIFRNEQPTIETTAEAIPAETLLPETVFEDGIREKYIYSADGSLISKTVYDASDQFVARYDYTYDGVDGIIEEKYNAAGVFVQKTVLKEDGTQIVTEYRYDADNKLKDGTTVRIDANGVVRQEDTLNKYAAVTQSIFYNENGKRIETRIYHFTSAGYDDGYTIVDAAGKRQRYDKNGRAVPDPKETVATMAATTTTAPPTSMEPEGPTTQIEEIRNGSDRVEKYYYAYADGKKTLFQTKTYRTINGKEVVLRSIDELNGYGRENAYDGTGNLTSYLTYNVKYGKRTMEIKHNPDGSVVYTKTYEYDNDGRRIRENQYDTDEQLTGYITYEYIDKDDGTYKTRVVTHDAKGVVIGTVVH